MSLCNASGNCAGSGNSRFGLSPCAIAGFALLGVMAVDSAIKHGSSGCGAPDQTAVVSAQAQTAKDIEGLWSRYEGMSEGDPVRFWYFHGIKEGKGHGLYRYGRVGYSNTHSFDYTIEGQDGAEVLRGTFRKSGERFETKIELGSDGHVRQLVLANDPRDPGATYNWARGPLDYEGADVQDSLADHRANTDASNTAAPFAQHMWIDYKSYATGGNGFAMYQFGPATLDGRGVGWFHEGDFDEWRTEALSYRVDRDRLELYFDLNQELGISPFKLEGEGAKRELVLDADPRDFWLHHRYTDMGRSFAHPALAPMAAVQAMDSAIAQTRAQRTYNP